MGKTKIRDMGDNKNINIPIGEKDKVFRQLRINQNTGTLMDVKKGIFEFYGIRNPEMTVQNSRKTLSQQRPDNAFGVRITDAEMHKFMELFNLTEDDWFQECIGGRIVSDILEGRTFHRMEPSKR